MAWWHGIEGFFVAAKELADQVVLSSVGTGGLERVPLERNRSGHVEGLGPLNGNVLQESLVAPRRGRQVDRFARTSDDAKPRIP